MKTAMERRAFRIGFDPLHAAGKRGLHDQQPAPKELRPVQLIDAWVRAVAQDEAPHGRLMYMEAVDAIRLAYPATMQQLEPLIQHCLQFHQHYQAFDSPSIMDLILERIPELQKDSYYDGAFEIKAVTRFINKFTFGKLHTTTLAMLLFDAAGINPLLIDEARANREVDLWKLIKGRGGGKTYQEQKAGKTLKRAIKHGSTTSEEATMTAARVVVTYHFRKNKNAAATLAAFQDRHLLVSATGHSYDSFNRYLKQHYAGFMDAFDKVPALNP